MTISYDNNYYSKGTHRHRHTHTYIYIQREREERERENYIVCHTYKEAVLNIGDGAYADLNFDSVVTQSTVWAFFLGKCSKVFVRPSCINMYFFARAFVM